MKFIYKGVRYDTDNITSDQFELMKKEIKQQSEKNKSLLNPVQVEKKVLTNPKRLNRGGK
jgi:hypothetical protein